MNDETRKNISVHKKYVRLFMLKAIMEPSTSRTILTAIIRICDTDTTTDYTPSLERSIITLIAGMDDRLGIHEAIANDTFAITLFA